MKRLFDIVVSSVLLLPALPVIALVAFVIRLETPGNPFFRQTRLGRDERPFTIWKLRSMHRGTPQKGTHEVVADAYTRTGRIIRATKLDELPQLVNVLKGEMSLVGPRPCLPNQSDVISERRKKNVFSVRPGITGLAQINSVDMSTPQDLARIDRDYIDRRSLWLDLSICVKTLART